ncbi:putative endonuclease [Chitinophaga sp. CF118]|uniref:YraN family protein n=1 Tax=Chitinophaga sp. CF118 TaxID=1884367 RepID=UPI0008F246EC|nr:YraN family protein [Chitinophaga sp. CF118]SFE53348.1 putative endonuclease [Chitinophaga sp. CF118]
MASHLDLGKKGELLAQEYLLKANYQVLHTNWRHRRREIDIIASQPGCLVFFEVKTLSNDLYGWPEQKVNARKRFHIQAAAEVYIDRIAQPPKAIRFDIISITFQSDGTHELLHMEDAF